MATHAPRATGRPNSKNGNWLRRLLAVPEARWPLAVEPAPLRELPLPTTLTLFLGRAGLVPPALSPTVVAGDEVAAGQPLASFGDRPAFSSPRAGKVAAVTQVADVRGGKPGLAVVLEPSTDGTGADGASPAGFAPLDPAETSPEALLDRIRAAGIVRAGTPPVPLVDVLGRDPEVEAAPTTLVVTAVDSEPGLSSALRQYVDDPVAAVRATRLLARATGSARAVLAVPAPHESTARTARTDGVEILSIAPEYPAGLPACIARTAGDPDAVVVPVAAALAALAAVSEGRLPDTVTLTVLGPDAAPLANVRVPLGTPLADVFAAMAIDPRPGDAIVVGGPLRGLAQYSLDAAVDASVEGLALLPAGTFPAWSDEPCINCGACIDVCPESLQAHHLARFAEFHLFDRTTDHGIDDCIECGLCATVCPARRPLLQLIRLAKRELAAAAARKD